MTRRKITTWTEKEALKMSREVPDKTVEIVRTYRGRTGKQSARRNVKPPDQFLIEHEDGTISVAEFV
jgi:hypothetical protein